MPDKNDTLITSGPTPQPAPSTPEYIPDNLKILFGDYGHTATANRQLPTADYHLVAPEPQPRVYNFDLDDIVGTHTPIHYADSTDPDPEEIKKHLTTAFQKMFAQINGILDTVDTSEHEPQPFIWPYPVEPQGRTDDAPHFKTLLANELFNPPEAHKYIEQYNQNKEGAVPVKAPGRKISDAELEKVTNYIKTLPDRADKDKRSPAFNNYATPPNQLLRNNSPQDHTKVIRQRIGCESAQCMHHYCISSKLFNAIIEWLRKQDHHMADKEHLDIEYVNSHGITFYSADVHNNDETRAGVPDAMVDATDLIALLTVHAGNESGRRLFDATTSGEKAVDFLHHLLDNTITKDHEGKSKAELNAIFDEEKRREETEKNGKTQDKAGREPSISKQGKVDTSEWWTTSMLVVPDGPNSYQEVEPAPGKSIDDYGRISPEGAEVHLKKR